MEIVNCGRRLEVWKCHKIATDLQGRATEKGVFSWNKEHQGEREREMLREK